MILAAAAIALAAATPAFKSLGDAELRAYAARQLDLSRISAFDIIGTYHGVRVIAETHCSDLCPDYTVRIIHYDIVSGDRCKAVGGVPVKVMVPHGVAAMPRTFCVPRLISAGAVRHY